MLLSTPTQHFELSCRHVNMTGMIDALTKCKLHSIIHILQTEGNSAAEIHGTMTHVYRENYWSDAQCCSS